MRTKDNDGFERETTRCPITGARIETVYGWAFEAYPRSEQGAFCGPNRDCTPGLYPASPTPEGAMEIARQRGETEETGEVVAVERPSLGRTWTVTAG